MAKCGRCGQHHDTAAEVRDCYNRPQPKKTRTAPPSRTIGQEPPMTEKQRKYALSLMESRGISEKDMIRPLDDYDKRSISVLINNLREMPEAKPVTKRDEPAEPGMYRTKDGEIYKVQVAVHGSGRPYAKKLVVVEDAERDDEGKIVRSARVRFDYANGVVFRLSKDDRLKIEDAKKFGALYGTCVRCGRTLTQEQSIERMMGPVCYGKEYDPNFTQAIDTDEKEVG